LLALPHRPWNEELGAVALFFADDLEHPALAAPRDMEAVDRSSLERDGGGARRNPARAEDAGIVAVGAIDFNQKVRRVAEVAPLVAALTSSRAQKKKRAERS
jgi:hypothetical protein